MLKMNKLKKMNKLMHEFHCKPSEQELCLILYF